MLHIELNSLETSRVNSYLREAKNENRQSSGTESVGHDESNETKCESQKNERPNSPKKSIPEVSHYQPEADICSKKLEELLAKLDLCSTSDDEETTEELAEEKGSTLTPKNGDSFHSQDADRRASYEKLRQRNEKMAQDLRFCFEDSGFDGGLFSNGITLPKLEEGLRHLRRLRRFLDVVRDVERHQVKMVSSDQVKNQGLNQMQLLASNGTQSVTPIPYLQQQPQLQLQPQQFHHQPQPQPPSQWAQTQWSQQTAGQADQAMAISHRPQPWNQCFPQVFHETSTGENSTFQFSQQLQSNELSVMANQTCDDNNYLDPELLEILCDTSNSP